MEFKLVVDDNLIARTRQFFRRGGIVLMALLMAVPVLLLARSAMNEYGLTVFEAGKVISSSDVNENFNVLAQQSDALQSSIDSLEAAITVDGNNKVGIGSTSPSANLDVKGNLSKALSGIVSTAKGSSVVTGSDTKFMDELKVGDAIGIGAEVFTVAGIKAQDSLTIDPSPTTSLGGALAYTDSDLLSIKNGAAAGKVLVDKSGNVGVGSATPTAKLQVDGFRRAFTVNGSWGGDDFTNPVAKIVSTDSGVTESGTIFNKKNGGTNFDLLNVHYQGSSRLLVHSEGNVGIGTTSPSQRLHVAGKVTADDYLFNSDARLKRDVSPLENAADGIACLQGVTYRWEDASAAQDLQIGLIAQDVENCFPEVVTTDPQGYKSVSYSRLVAPLVEAVKEQQGTISVQQRELRELRAALVSTNERLSKIEARLNRAP